MIAHVEVQSTTGEWTTHSEHDSIREAFDQADLVHGRVRCRDTEAICEAFCDWTEDVEGYCVLDYFDDDGLYKGPDEFGIEPLFD